MEILSADMRAATEVLQGVTSMELFEIGASGVGCRFST